MPGRGRLQALVLDDSGTITAVAAPKLCLTAGQDTRMGRRGTSQHQIKDLILAACDDELATYQTWRTRASDD